MKLRNKKYKQPNRNDVLNLTFNDYLKVMFKEKIIPTVEYAQRLQKVWIGWATLNIYNKLNNTSSTKSVEEE